MAAWHAIVMCHTHTTTTITDKVEDRHVQNEMKRNVVGRQQEETAALSHGRCLMSYSRELWAVPGGKEKKAKRH